MSSQTPEQVLARLTAVRTTIAEVEASPLSQYSIKDRQAIMQRLESLRNAERHYELLYQRVSGAGGVRYPIPRMS